MFDNTFAYGSVVGLLLLTYSTNVAIEVLRVQHYDPGRTFTAGLPHTALGTLFSFAALPCVIWPAVYVWGHDGWLAAIIAWILLQVAGGLATFQLGIRGAMLPLHLMLGLVALPVGYYLTITSASWGAL